MPSSDYAILWQRQPLLLTFGNAVQAFSRLAALLREVGHVEGANAALERLIKLPGGNAGEAQARLREVQALARRRAVTDHYKLLGLLRSASAEEVRLERAASVVHQASWDKLPCPRMQQVAVDAQCGMRCETRASYALAPAKVFAEEGKQGRCTSSAYTYCVEAWPECSRVAPCQVRRAYKRSALSHHPDKALAQCRFAVRLGSPGVAVVSAVQASPCPCAPAWAT